MVLIPLYWIVITSFKASSDYYQQNAFAPPSNPTLANYRLVLENDFVHYFVNSVAGGGRHDGARRSCWP